MKKFNVCVIRTSYAMMNVEVIAENEEAAKKAAIDESKNNIFSEYDADYGIEDINIL